MTTTEFRKFDHKFNETFAMKEKLEVSNFEVANSFDAEGFLRVQCTPHEWMVTAFSGSLLDLPRII